MLPYWPSVTPAMPTTAWAIMPSAGERRGSVGIAGTSYSRRANAAASWRSGGAGCRRRWPPGRRRRRAPARPARSPVGRPRRHRRRSSRCRSVCTVGHRTGRRTLAVAAARSQVCRRADRPTSRPRAVTARRPAVGSPCRWARAGSSGRLGRVVAVVGGRRGRAIGRRRPVASDAVQIVGTVGRVGGWAVGARRPRRRRRATLDRGRGPSCPARSCRRASPGVGAGAGRALVLVARRPPSPRCWSAPPRPAGATSRRRRTATSSASGCARRSATSSATRRLSWAVVGRRRGRRPRLRWPARRWVARRAASRRRRGRGAGCCPAAGTSSAGAGWCSSRPASWCTTRSCWPTR